MNVKGVPGESLSGVSDDAGRILLAGRTLAEVPGWLGNLATATELDLSRNRLTSLPDWIGNLTGLTELRLAGNRLTALPGWLANLPGLQTLNLDGTELAGSGFAYCPACAR
jgi:Leucine-rich repeat (LRR) protein